MPPPRSNVAAVFGRGACVVAVLAIAGCTPDADVRGHGLRTADGAEIVENVEPRWRSGEGWSVEPVPALAIGGEEDPAFQFHGIRGAARLSDGRIAVGDGGSGQVRLFTPAGEVAAVAGGPGAGPEEFRRMSRLVATPHDSLVVFDAGNRRISVLDAGGTFARTMNLATVGVGADLAGVLDNGWFVLSVPLPVPPAEGLSRDSVLYLLLSPDGQAVDTIGAAAGGQRFQRIDGARVTRLTVPFGPMPAAAAGGDQVILGSTDEYELRQYRSDGGAARLIRRRVTPQPFTDAHFEEVVAASPRYESALREIPRPRHRPVFASVVMDRQGNLWIQDPPEPGAERTPWAVFTSEGAFLGSVSLPSSLRPTDVGSDYVLGVWTDELGVEEVRLYGLGRAGV
jgi:hypothetical protein